MRADEHLRLALAEIGYYRELLKADTGPSHDTGWLEYTLLKWKIGELEVRIKELRSMSNAR